MLYECLDLDERNRILEKMTIEQRDFLENSLKRGRKTVFANALTKKKAETFILFEETEEIREQLEWELIDYIDGGTVSKDLLCECGKQLRYQYIVKNKKSGQVLKFGSTHFEEHTGIPANIVRLVIKGIQKIDFEMDEILNKFEDGYNLDKFKSFNLPEGIIPKDILQQMSLELPLLDRQERRLYQIYNDFSKRQFSKSLNELKTKRIKTTQKNPIDSNFIIQSESNFNTENNPLYQNHLLDDCIVMITNGLNSVNLMVEELLKQPEYKVLFNGFTQRMCYIMVVSTLVEVMVKNGNLLEGRGLLDRTDAYFYLQQ